LRENGLHIFRHRRGMLFVSPIYPRPFTNQQTAVSSQVRTIMDAIAASPRIGRKELADKLIIDLAGEDADRAKLALASNLLWLISAGHVIEFNDGSLDLPRAKAKPKENVAAAVSAVKEEESVVAGVPPAEKETVDVAMPAVSETPNSVVAAVVSTAEPNKQALETSASTTEPTEIGGS